MTFSRLFTHNWQVKVVAFFLAIALWLYTSGQARIERTLQVRVQESSVRSLPPDYQVTSITPTDFRVDVDGPSTLIADLPSDTIEPVLVVSADALGRGQQTFPITQRALGLPVDVRVQRVQPENVEGITVTFGRIIVDHLATEERPELIDEPSDIDVKFEFDKNQVRVRGPQNVIADLRARGEKVRFEPVSLRSVDRQLAEPTTLRLQLTPRELATTTILDAVNATITVIPRTTAKQTVPLPVNLLVPADFWQLYRVELAYSQVALTVHGPANLLQELRPASDVVVYLNLLRGFEPDVPREAKLSVLGPAWATFEDATVRCTVRVVSRPAPPAPAPEAPSGDQP